ncbi:MAG: glycoside hydrolase 43 family protein [Verrucomicrobiota bacterium]|jgi:beta-xylosidase
MKLRAMNFRAALALMALAPLFVAGAASAASPAPWSPDLGNGDYRNPVLFADYSDPDVIRVGDDFYLTASSFNCVPGLPVLHSKDLVNWTIIGHAIQRFNYGDFDVPQHGNGVWAPSIRFHDGQFYIYYGDPDYGIFMTQTTNAAGPWRPLVRVHQARGWIDCCPFWDDDGAAYLVHAFAASRAGSANALHLNRMSPDGASLLDEGKLIIDGNAAGLATLEGPKMYKRGAYYYILAPAGGVTGGSQMAFRSKSVYGPYEQKRVLAQGATPVNGPHQGGWVLLQSGESWFLHFQDRGPYGRVTHLEPVHWVEDWPRMGTNQDSQGVGEPVRTFKKPDVGRSFPIEVPQTSDDFDSPNLGLQWQWQANPKEQWMSLTARPGWLRLNAVPMPANATNHWLVPNLLLQKFPAEQFIVTARLDTSRLSVGDQAGLIIMGMDYSYLAVEKTAAGRRLTKVVCHNANNGGKDVEESSADSPGDLVFLRVKVSPGAVCEFAHSLDGGQFTSIGGAFRARAGRWIGAKAGLYCLSKSAAPPSGSADFDWFRFEITP